MLTAFITGFVGSLHCVGMCGAIALALPSSNKGKVYWFAGRLTYNFGRIITYMFLGLLVGLIGTSVSWAGLQQGLSISLGVLLLILSFFSLQIENKFFSIPFIEKKLAILRTSMGRLFRRKGAGTYFSIGLLNGLLPCGFVYLALAGASLAGELIDSMSYMAIFGLGTLPAMLLVSWLGNRLTPKMKQSIRPIMLVFAFLFAILLIVRGLGLDIPYISPLPDLEAAEGCAG